ncbi:hypothetical protein [Microbulbifer yueqingensis]|uniref:Uncharacterized protein n=1 Tax=Microbulbifer yueqingensis TaxID=658219 RepID=A0A1G8UQ37_9GAMM|nr:hypothetical protein [Microbulbifer yueqingensis]SDJ55617.1 hypothetical protein SAMN05216212_0214 [Microbulbifer yueqingensis]
MELLQRYVDNVKIYLPGDERDDIGNELYSGLLDQCDELSDTLGREATESEVAELLKRNGHPMEVAAGYRPRKALVSEALLPLYMQVLKWVFLAVIIGNGVAAVMGVLNQPQPQFLDAALAWLAGSINAGLQSFALVTLGFFLAGESLSFRDVFGKWEPRNLPRVAAAGQRISSFDSAVELVAMVLVAGWLNDLFPATGFGGMEVTVSSGLHALLPWLNGVIALSLLMALDKLFLPFWTRAKLVVESAIRLLWLFLLGRLYYLDEVLTVQWGGAGEYFWEMPQAYWQLAVIAAILGTGWGLLQNLWRYRQTVGATRHFQG